MASLVSGIQHSGAQDIPGKIETPNLPPSVKDENGQEPDVQGEEPTLKDDGQSQVQPQPQQALPPQAYRVKVLFKEITVHDDEEPAPFDDGEYTMRAVVNGKYVNLDKGSGGKLWDVSSGERVTFAPYTYAIFEIPYAKFPISIYTLGFEADVCPRAGYGDVVTYNPNIMPILKGPQSEWLPEIRRIIDNDIFARTTGEFNCHDRIGFINKIHQSPEYSDVLVEFYDVKSTNADYPDSHLSTLDPNFTLKYDIYFEKIPPK